MKVEASMEGGRTSHRRKRFQQCVICYTQACSKCHRSPEWAEEVFQQETTFKLGLKDLGRMYSRVSLKRSLLFRRNSIRNTEKITTVKIILMDTISECLPCTRDCYKSFIGINSPKLQNRPCPTVTIISWLDHYNSLAAGLPAAVLASWLILIEQIK